MNVVRPSSPRPNQHMVTFDAMLRVPEVMRRIFMPALQISAIEHPDMPQGWERHCHQQLVDLAREAAARVPGEGTPLERCGQLCRFLFEESGFKGNAIDYHDPRNSCLTDVLERRVGIPITLSLVLMSVGHELGLEVHGIGAPGHYLCAVDRADGTRMFIDCFQGGVMFDREDAQRRVRAVVGNVEDAICNHLLRAATPSDTLARMLGNLKVTYAQRGNLRRALAALDWLLLVQPANLSEIRSRGLVLLRMGNFTRAVQDLAFYVRSAPEAEDQEVIRHELERAITALAKYN